MTIGIESHVTDDIVPREGALRVSLCLVRGSDPLAADDQVPVEVRARVFDLAEVYRRGVVPDHFIQEGPPIATSATTQPTTVDLLLPGMPPGRYGVVAKVLSRDPRYPTFQPSNCYLREVALGQRFVIEEGVLRAIYGRTTGNPVVEDVVRGLVRQREVIARGATGALYRATERPDGGLELVPLPHGRMA